MKAQLKKTIITMLFFCFLLTLASSSVVQAETTATPAPNTPYRDEAKQLRDDRKTYVQEKREDIKENRQEIQEKRQETRSDIAENHSQRLEKRFTAYYDRLSKLLTKVQERINKFAAEKKDVSGAQAKLDEAEDTLQQAKELGDQAIAKFNSIEPTKYQEQRSVALEARDLAQQARTEYLKSLGLMKEAVQLLKKLVTN